MNISKISRSIIVAIFVVFIIFLSFLNMSNFLNRGKDVTFSVTSTLMKVCFAVVVIVLVCIYMYIKDKLYKLHVKRKLSFIYRYIYIVLVLIGSSIFSAKGLISTFSDNKIIFYVITSIINCFIIKKIIFNVSKGDMLSVLGMFTCALFPRIIVDNSTYIASTIFTTLFLGAILVFQILIDELKQKGIKTKKYIIESIILGILMGLTSVCGVSLIAWCTILLLSIFITYNLDNTHINFPKKFMASLTQSKRESLYKIERININKLIVAICIALILLFSINFVLTKVIINIDMSSNNGVIHLLSEQIHAGKISSINTNVKELLKSGKLIATNFLNSASVFHMVVFVYILLMELLAFALNRRYDTKSTLMKIMFLILFLSIIVFNLNIYYFEPILTMLLILIAIVNTSNIYLNREERIKMLVA